MLVLETAEEGLNALKKRSYDIFIVDYRLPGIDGLEFFKRVQFSHREAYKIMITAYKDQNMVSQAPKIGIDDFIEKPFSIQTLEKVLSRLLEEPNTKKNSELNSLTKPT